MTHYFTYKYRIKDSSVGNHLSKMANACNFVWNYCNEANIDSWSKFGRPLSGYDLQKLTKGCGKELGIPAQTIQRICEEYSRRARKHRKRTLSWRSVKRNLNWIPLRGESLRFEDDTFTLRKRKYKFWKSREIEGEVKTSTITEDSRGRWYINVTIKKEVEQKRDIRNKVGIDLGLKSIGVTSDGQELTRPNYTKMYADQLAIAQRARKKKRVTAIHAKIKNKRKDWNYKTAKELCDNYDQIVVGDVSSSKLAKTKMAKSMYDASWYGFKSALGTTAIKRGVDFRIVNESWSTVTCSVCKSKSGPSGLSALGVREWKCSNCGTAHVRDVNAAINILNSVQDIAPQSGAYTLT